MPTLTPRPVPPRIERLKAELFAAPTRFCFARARLVTQTYRACESMQPQPHPAVRRALALRSVFQEMPIFIRPGELIVGQRSEELAGRAVYPEYHLNGLTPETTPPEIWDYWQGRTIGSIVRRAHPERLRLAERELATAFATGTDSGFGHVIVDYEKAIQHGFKAIIAEAQTCLASAPEDDLEGRAFLQAVVIAAEGLIAWAERYADLAERLASKESDPLRKQELLVIARTCRRVPAEPARDLREAMQCFWFVHIAMHIEQFGWSISAGRFDQYMLPFYRQDLASGALAKDQAWELLLNLWVKFMENVDRRVKDTVFQNMTLGGQDLDGKDQSNELSCLCIEATVALRFNQPALSVRWHAGINPTFWNLVHTALAQGGGLPALFNDEVIIPTLVMHGVSPEDAVGYGLVGCVEASVPGKQQGMTAGGHINLAKALELALNGGRSMITGELIGLPTMLPDDFSSFDDLWTTYKTQVEYLAGLNILATHIAGEVQKQLGHCPLMSALLDDCLANRRDLVFGGTRYNLPGIGIFGSSNVCDAFMAVKRWVCEEKKLTWAELRQALQEDFAGREPLRLMLAQRTPRFGNGIAEVDEWVNRITAVHADYCWNQVDSRNGRYTCGIWPVTTHLGTGQWTAATPDGRHRGMPLVDGVGACQGADRRGPTALIQSVARLNNVTDWAAGNTFNIKFSAGSIHAGEGVEKLRDLSSTFMRLGGQEMQINVVDAETLRAAKTNPQAYRDLIVRVAGFSAYFTQLSPEVQDEIISRTEQTV